MSSSNNSTKTNNQNGTDNPGANSSNPSTSSTSHSTNLLVTTNESIKLIAESIGISNVTDEGCREISNDLTFTIKSILLDAQTFARRSRRKQLLASDIDYSLKVKAIEPIYGFDSYEQTPFRCTTSTGGNGSGRTIYYAEDQIVDLNDLINQNNQTLKLPNDFVINAHWLAIEGVQPSVPENPQLVSREAQKKEVVEGAAKPKEKQLQQQQKRNIGDSLVKIKTLIPHDLSIEQQIYFKEITEACVGSDEQKRSEALNSLSTDPSLHQLLPRFVLFISEGVRLNLVQFNMPLLIHLMRMTKSLVENKSIYLEKYLHEILPSIISCQLSKQICARPEIDNHYALREFCARLIGQIVNTYGPTLTSLKPKIVKIYMNSIAEKTTFSTLFGAILGIAELGDEIIETFIFPLVKSLGERITQILDSTASNQEKIPADRVKKQLIEIITNVLKSKPPLSNDEFDYLTTEFGAYFGQLIHAELMKYKSQRAQAQIAAINSNNRQTTKQTINPTQIQYIRPAGNGPQVQANSTSLVKTNAQTISNEVFIEQDITNSNKLVKLVSTEVKVNKIEMLDTTSGVNVDSGKQVEFRPFGSVNTNILGNNSDELNMSEDENSDLSKNHSLTDLNEINLDRMPTLDTLASSIQNDFNNTNDDIENLSAFDNVNL